jgi:uncharacterized membrane protein (DUF2068 family)
MRPLGVTLIGSYQILRGILGVLFGLAMLAFAGLAAKLASLAAEGSALERRLSGLGHVIGLGIIVFAVLELAAGYGVLQMHNWGRFLTLLFSAIGLVLLLPGMTQRDIFSLVFGLLNAATLFYLASPPMKRAFQAGGSALKMAT